MFCQATNTREKTWFWSLLTASSVTARCAQRRKTGRMEKDWGDTAFSGYCWCPWQLQGSLQWQPDPWTAWVPPANRLSQGLTLLAQVKGKAAGEEGRRKTVGYKRNARRKSSCVPGQCPFGGMPFRSGFPLSVRNPIQCAALSIRRMLELQSCSLMGVEAGATLFGGSGSAACPPTGPLSIW